MSLALIARARRSYAACNSDRTAVPSSRGANGVRASALELPTDVGAERVGNTPAINKSADMRIVPLHNIVVASNPTWSVSTLLNCDAQFAAWVTQNTRSDVQESLIARPTELLRSMQNGQPGG